MRTLKISNWYIGWKYGGILFLALAFVIITA
ncbi:putative outer membrane lipoprotein [Gracilibacillus halotolerans]|uniref:Putative outer membrane lipoprotein n=1 Tax=Gracilibacillus halotolerans TaxID=74386 RepID=A0A841RRU7_9BACI|nr:putative outer membrane lipoprotein [Gracilibacillus halotolerans]